MEIFRDLKTSNLERTFCDVIFVFTKFLPHLVSEINSQLQANFTELRDLSTNWRGERPIQLIPRITPFQWTQKKLSETFWLPENWRILASVLFACSLPSPHTPHSQIRAGEVGFGRFRSGFSIYFWDPLPEEFVGNRRLNLENWNRFQRILWRILFNHIFLPILPCFTDHLLTFFFRWPHNSARIWPTTLYLLAICLCRTVEFDNRIWFLGIFLINWLIKLVVINKTCSKTG